MGPRDIAPLIQEEVCLSVKRHQQSIPGTGPMCQVDVSMEQQVINSIVVVKQLDENPLRTCGCILLRYLNARRLADITTGARPLFSDFKNFSRFNCGRFIVGHYDVACD
jgi:hypothetical protein